jgi:hypothetical protein
MLCFAWKKRTLPSVDPILMAAPVKIRQGMAALPGGHMHQAGGLIAWRNREAL